MTTTVRGWHIAFLLFALLFLCVPVTKWAIPLLELPPSVRAVADRALHVIVLAIVVFAVPAIRRRALDLLRVPISPGAKTEAIAITTLAPVLNLGLVGGLATWAFVSTGPEGVERMMANSRPPTEEWSRALSLYGLLFSVLLAGFIGPLVEEVVFRGFLQGAWERRWGWFTAVFMTSVVFGLYHPNPIAAFASGVVFSCLYRRAGSLRAAIACHVVGNLSLWYPLMGQFLFPPRSMAMGDPMSWALQLSCLAFTIVFMPVYFFFAAIRPADEAHTTVVLRQPA